MLSLGDGIAIAGSFVSICGFGIVCVKVKYNGNGKNGNVMEKTCEARRTDLSHQIESLKIVIDARFNTIEKLIKNGK